MLVCPFSIRKATCDCRRSVWCKGSKSQVGYAAPQSLRRGLGIRQHSAVSNPSTRKEVTDGKIPIDMFVREGQTEKVSDDSMFM